MIKNIIKENKKKKESDKDVSFYFTDEEYRDFINKNYKNK
jgi:hypothetical protein